MIRSVSFAFAVGALLLSGAAGAQSPEEKGLKIAQDADAYDAGYGDVVALGKMILRNKQGQESVREFETRTLETADDGDKIINLFHKPRDVRGTALLTYSHKTGDDDQWLYLPALKRVKRISSSNKSGSFVGSEFSYEDLSSPEVPKYTYKWLRDEACPGADGLQCFVVERYPTDKTSGYKRQVIWTEQQTYRAFKIDYYDRKDAFLKTLTYEDYKEYLDHYWRPGRMVMVNHQTGKSTDMLWDEYTFKGGLSESDFTPARLKNIR